MTEFEYKKVYLFRQKGEIVEFGYIDYAGDGPSIVRDAIYHDGRNSYPIRGSNTIGQKLEDVIASHEAGGWQR